MPTLLPLPDLQRETRLMVFSMAGEKEKGPAPDDPVFGGIKKPGTQSARFDLLAAGWSVLAPSSESALGIAKSWNEEIFFGRSAGGNRGVTC